MPWSERLAPVMMQRVALVAPRARLRGLLCEVADSGTVEIDRGDTVSLATPSSGKDNGASAGSRPALAAGVPDVAEWERTGRFDLIAGEAELAEFAAAAVRTDALCALAGWCPTHAIPELTDRLSRQGCAVVPLARPRGVDPPTLLRRTGEPKAFTTLVQTYSTVPYADIDPTPFAGVTFVVMFGMMFGDVGDGLLLLLIALLARLGRPQMLVRLRGVAWFIAALGLSGIFFGLLYGEFFGPTGVVPVLWISPTEEPLTLLAVALALGALLLACAYLIGTVNRVREGGWVYALYEPTGIAGCLLFAGVGLVTGGLLTANTWVLALGCVLALTGLSLAFVGLLAAAGGGGAGVTEAIVEVVDLVIRLASNIVSFARLAAFGLAHAALSAVVWTAASGLWGTALLASVLAIVIFVVGNLAAFAIEALVAGVQALRLEYYELFSRVFTGEGRPFHPWHVPISPTTTPAPEEGLP